MATSEARVEANRRNAVHSTGPKTEAGKAKSRRNALKHGLTAEVIIPEAEAAEVETKFRTMRAELQPSTMLADELVRQIAKYSVRVRRCEIEETARLTERVKKAMAEAAIPEGATDEEIAEIRAHAADLALFDPSPEAERARKYEAAAQRAFFRAIQEFRRVEAAPKPVSAVEQTLKAMGPLASFLKPGGLDRLDGAEAGRDHPQAAPPGRRNPRLRASRSSRSRSGSPADRARSANIDENPAGGRPADGRRSAHRGGSRGNVNVGCVETHPRLDIGERAYSNARRQKSVSGANGPS